MWAGLLLATTSGQASSQATLTLAGPDHGGATGGVLDVPFVSQTDLLCGGAAVAMVERYWGRRGVYAEDFAHLVRAELGGITTEALAMEAMGRGWRTVVRTGSWRVLRDELDSGRPVIALIAAGESRFHYVVVVGWANGVVTYHDPAIGPHQVQAESPFIESWTAASRWSLVLLPDREGAETRALSARGSGGAVLVLDEPGPCTPFVEGALASVAAGSFDRAAAILVRARSRCPEDDAVLRELAGVRFRQSRFAAAAALAAHYTERRPEDEYAWQLVAASRYLAGDPLGALDAWGRIGRATVDLVRIDRATRTRFGSLERALGIATNEPLSRSSLSLANRRLAATPGVASAKVDYRPVPEGRVEVIASLVERSHSFAAAPQFARQLVQGAVDRRVNLQAPNLVGTGELLRGSVGWLGYRQEVQIELSVPASLGIPGVARLAAAWDRSQFDLGDTGDDRVSESRRSGSVGFAAWFTPSVIAGTEVALHRWSADRDYVAVSGGGALLTAHDRFTLHLNGTVGLALGPHPGFASAQLGAEWRSGTDWDGLSWAARGGAAVVDPDAPLSAWPVVGSDVRSAIPLRGHTTANAGAIVAARLASTVLHGGAATVAPITRVGPIRLGVALFVDAAYLRDRPSPSLPGRWYLDGGGGLRIGWGDPWTQSLRIDVAAGLLDRSTAISVGFAHVWSRTHGH